MKLNSNDLKKIRGGISITSSLLNSLSKGIDSILEVGRSLGGALRRMMDNNACRY